MIGDDKVDHALVIPKQPTEEGIGDRDVLDALERELAKGLAETFDHGLVGVGLLQQDDLSTIRVKRCGIAESEFEGKDVLDKCG